MGFIDIDGGVIEITLRLINAVFFFVCLVMLVKRQTNNITWNQRLYLAPAVAIFLIQLVFTVARLRWPYLEPIHGFTMAAINEVVHLISISVLMAYLWEACGPQSNPDCPD